MKTAASQRRPNAAEHLLRRPSGKAQDLDEREKQHSQRSAKVGKAGEQVVGARSEALITASSSPRVGGKRNDGSKHSFFFRSGEQTL